MAETKRTPPLSSQAKQIVYNVSSYFKEETKTPSKTPKSGFPIKTSEATGVSERTVSNIRTEKKETGQLASRKKIESRRSSKILDDFDLCAIRNKIHEFYTVRKELPTLEKLHKVLKEDIRFSGSKSFLRKQVRKLGFRWRRSQNRRKLLIERYNIFDLRCAYLRRIKAYREQGLNLVYIDETWIETGYTAKFCWQSKEEPGVYESISKGERLVIVHAGGKKGFVPNALEVLNAKSNKGDYHNEMNGGMFLKWYTEKLLANLNEKSVIIMDNASYHSVQSEKKPTSSSRKADIQQWLCDHNVQFENDMLRPQLLALAKAHKPPPKYVIDNLTKERGHEILRLPPYHPDLNPIELSGHMQSELLLLETTPAK